MIVFYLYVYLFFNKQVLLIFSSLFFIQTNELNNILR